MYTVNYTGISAYEGDDIGVFYDDQLIKGFNTLSDDYAYTNAVEYKRKIERRESNQEYKYKQIASQLDSGDERYTLKVGDSKHVNITREQVQQIADIFKDI